jgi:putative FmdB family regulatory protein
MPLYEFRCPSGHDFEKFYRSIGSAPTEERCPECGVIAERLMSAAGLVFKGSGFYITDYGKDGKKAEREAAKTASDKTEKAETAKTEKSETPTAASDSKSGDTAKAKSADSASPAPAKGSTEAKPAAAAPKPAPAKKSE